MSLALGPDDATALLDHTTDGVVLLDGALRIVAANPPAERLFRTRASDIVGQEWWTLAQDARTAEAEETVRRVVEHRIAGRVELFHPKLYAWHAVIVAPRGTDGLALFIRDVTDRMRLLRDEAVRSGIREVINQAPLAITISRGIEHRFEIVNESARRLLGGRDVEGETLRLAFPELVEQGFLELADRIMTTGESYAAREMPIRYVRGSGANAEVVNGVFDVHYSPLRGSAGEITGILSVSVDVTDQVDARRRIDQLAREREATLATLTEGVIITDAEGRITFVNDAARELHGQAALDVAPDDYAATYALLREDGSPYPSAELPLARAAREQVTTRNARWRIRRPDGSVILVEGGAAPICIEDGTCVGAVLALHPVPDEPASPALLLGGDGTGEERSDLTMS